MDTLIIVAVVGAALGYAGWKAWGLFKPGSPSSCGCSGSAKGCTSCPVSDLKAAARK